MRLRLLIATLCLSLTACGGERPPAPLVSPSRSVNVPAEIKRTTDSIDGQVGTAPNNRYNRFTWMSDGTFCYRTETRDMMVKSCFAPRNIDPTRITVSGSASSGENLDWVVLSCRRRACISQSLQQRYMLGPQNYEQRTSLYIAASPGDGTALVGAFRYLLDLASRPGNPARAWIPVSQARDPNGPDATAG